jgi:hypothetical protein
MVSVEAAASSAVVDSPDQADSAYEQRKAMLSADANGGESAIVVDPIETQAWFVHHTTSLVENSAEDPERVSRLIELAGTVARWTSRLAEAGERGSEAGASPAEAHRES